MSKIGYKLKPGNLYYEMSSYTQKIIAFLIFLEKNDADHNQYIFYNINKKELWSYGHYSVILNIREI